VPYSKSTHVVTQEKIRKQLPIPPMIASTIDSSQGLGLKKQLLVIIQPFFSHGPGFTSLTRVAKARDLMVAVMKNQKTIRNPVNKYNTEAMNVLDGKFSPGKKRVWETLGNTMEEEK
jgi:hypothetical protein